MALGSRGGLTTAAACTAVQPQNILRFVEASECCFPSLLDRDGVRGAYSYPPEGEAMTDEMSDERVQEEEEEEERREREQRERI